MAGIALVGASVLAGAPVVAPPTPPQLRSVSSEVRLAASPSLLNVPANLLIDIVNIPHNEVRALDYFARSLLFSGPWFVVGPTNVWGVDPGDPPKFMAVVNMVLPFPALSGIDRDAFDQNGLGQQVWFFMATQLPVSEHCDDDGCMPTVPTAPITGIAVIDSTLWAAAILTGQVKFPLFDNFFKVPISDLMSGYTFGPDYPGRVNSAGPVYPGFGFAGSIVDPVTGENVMPWDGMTFTLDLSKPFVSYFDHLMADPSANPIQLPDLEDFGRALQSLAAALVVAFDPFTPGSFLCPGDCSYLPAAFDYPGIVRSIGGAWPGNPVIDEWLNAYDSGTANVPTEEQIDLAIRLKEGHFWTFGNESPPPEWSTGFNLSTLAPQFHALWTALGLNPPPLESPVEELEAPGEETVTVNASTGGPVVESVASLVQQFTNQTAQPASATSIAALTPNSETVNVNAASVAQDNVVTENPSTQAPQDVESITRAATEAPSNVAAAPTITDPNAGETPDSGSEAVEESERVTAPPKDGNKVEPGRVGGNGTTSHTDGPTGAVNSVTSQIRSGVAKFADGLSGGRHRTTSDNTGTSEGADNTGSTNTGNTDNTGRHRAKSDSSDNAGGSNSSGDTGGRHRAE
jgi:hypothetical protein